MNYKYVISCFCALFALSACGGSDDNGTSQPVPNNQTNNQQNNQANNQPANNGSTPTNNQTDNGVNRVGVNLDWIRPRVFVGPNTKATPKPFNRYPTVKKIQDIDDFRQIVVADKVITLPEYNGQNVGNPNNVSITTVSKDKVSAYARFGLLYMPIEKQGAHLLAYAQGTPTDENQIPTTGVVNYQGEAFAISPDDLNNLGVEQGQYRGRTSITVDFNKKTMQGIFKNWSSINNNAPNSVVIRENNPPSEINFEARIKGNTFESVASLKNYGASLYNDTYPIVKGSFYGPNAENIAGQFHDRIEDIQGVFGATKVNNKK
ncbi:MAG: transferrin-binding protein-like solute binding protein [Neisseriaceae bacterium]|nr:transferrin-binding protein-like solute binding protein [Neisseriaceae bacterium]